MRTLKNFIDGKWTDSSSGRRVQDLNPATTHTVLTTLLAVPIVIGALLLAHL